MAVLHVTSAFDDDIGVRLKQADHLLVGGDRFAMQDPTLGLGDDPLDQRPIMAELGPPRRGGQRVRRSPQQRRGLGGVGQGRAGQRDQIAIKLDPFRSIFPRAYSYPSRPLLRHAPTIMPREIQRSRRRPLQQPHQDMDGVPEKRAVARVMHQGGGDGAVDPHDLPVFEFLLPRTGNQSPIDRLPGLGTDGTDSPMQRRFLRGPGQRQPRKGSKRSRVFEIKGQFLVTQLALLFEQRAAQDRLGRQPPSPGLPSRRPDADPPPPARSVHAGVQPARNRLQFAADLVLRKDIK